MAKFAYWLKEWEEVVFFMDLIGQSEVRAKATALHNSSISMKFVGQKIVHSRVL